MGIIHNTPIQYSVGKMQSFRAVKRVVGLVTNEFYKVLKKYYEKVWTRFDSGIQLRMKGREINVIILKTPWP